MLRSMSSPTGKVTHLKAPKRDADTDNREIEATVRDIISAVRMRGDAAVRGYGNAFDKVDVAAFEVTDEERAEAVRNLDPQTRQDTEFAIERVRAFAQAQLGTI